MCQSMWQLMLLYWYFWAIGLTTYTKEIQYSATTNILLPILTIKTKYSKCFVLKAWTFFATYTFVMLHRLLCSIAPLSAAISSLMSIMGVLFHLSPSKVSMANSLSGVMVVSACQRHNLKADTTTLASIWVPKDVENTDSIVFLWLSFTISWRMSYNVNRSGEVKGDEDCLALLSGYCAEREEGNDGTTSSKFSLFFGAERQIS